MNYQPQNFPLTIEGLMASIEASNRYLTEKFAETDRIIKENAASLKETERIIKENAASQKETDRIIKENAASQKETDRQMKETDRIIKENAASLKETERVLSEKFAETDKKIEKTNQQIGGISQSNGEFCEEYFINAFKADPTFMGEKFDIILSHVKPYPIAVTNDEYDLILHNGGTVALIEMKYRAKVDDVGKMFKKLDSYRDNYPMYKDYKLYLCLASFSFSDDVKSAAAERGIVLIEHQGEKIEIVSENVRAW